MKDNLRKDILEVLEDLGVSVLFKCEDCEKRKSDVQNRICPYAEAITGSIIQVNLCWDCYGERMQAI